MSLDEIRRRHAFGHYLTNTVELMNAHAAMKVGDPCLITRDGLREAIARWSAESGRSGTSLATTFNVEPEAVRDAARRYFATRINDVRQAR